MNAIVETNNSQVIQETGFSDYQINLIKKTIMDETASIDDLMLFGQVCKKTGLDPFSRQIFAISRNTKSNDKWIKKWTFQISIDGFRAIADRTGQYAGSDDPLFDEGLTRYGMLSKERARPTTATVTVWKLVNNIRCPFTATASWNEYAVFYKDKLADLWAKMPFLMLAKCAESQALRKAFPLQLSGLYSPEEMQQAKSSEQEDWVENGLQWAVTQGIDRDRALELMSTCQDKRGFFEKVKREIAATEETIEAQSDLLKGKEEEF